MALDFSHLQLNIIYVVLRRVRRQGCQAGSFWCFKFAKPSPFEIEWTFELNASRQNKQHEAR
jgi:hypothetical protein